MQAPHLPTTSPIADPQNQFLTPPVWNEFFEWLSRLLRGNPGVCTFTWGEDSPEGAVTAPVGSFFGRTNGGANTTFYVKESGTGNTGWAAK